MGQGTRVTLDPWLLLYLKTGTFILDCRNDWRGFPSEIPAVSKMGLHNQKPLKSQKAIPSFELVRKG